MKLFKILLGLSLLVGLPTAFAENGGQHCVVQLQSVQPGEKVSWSKDLGCFPTFAEAINKATGVYIRSDVTPETITEVELSSAATSLIIGIDYDEANYKGASLTWSTDDPGACNGGYFYSFNMPNGYDNWLSSTKAPTSGGCNRNVNYVDRDFTGGYYFCTPDCPDMNGFDNQTSSKEWYKE